MIEADTHVATLAAAALALASGIALAWWLRGRTLARLRGSRDRLQAACDARERDLARALARGHELDAEIAALSAQLDEQRTRIEQLRDLVKVHVARRREFDEWAAPIKGSLGEGVGAVLRALKDELARQEATLERNERIVADARDQYRGKREELERMRRELKLKNYHIAALNERFIRIEERMQALGAQVAGLPAAAPADAPANPAATTRAEPLQRAAASPETERFTREDGANDWLRVLEDWHRELKERFDRMDELQERIRGSATPGPEPSPRRAGDGGHAA
ncbi:MAG: hypothetical protein IT531_14630 [Burkholderiales bacterium]|nr:hypothetical protein [Burkholderiales bacterium]